MKTSSISYSYNDQRGHLAASANEEWPELISTAKIGECLKVKTEILSKKPKKDINIKDISADDLKSVQRQDPFLYYSIPGVRSAKLLMKDIDLSNLGDSGAMSRNCISCPSRLETGQGEVQRSQRVSRSSRISFECYPDLLLEDLLDDDTEDLDGEDAEETLNSDLDFLMKLFPEKK